MKRKTISLAFLFLLAIGIGYLKANKFVNLDAREAALFSSQATIATKEIKIPGFPNAYNPSIIPFEDGYLLSFRVNCHDPITFIKKLWNHRTSFFGVVQLDKHFNPIEKAQLIDVHTCDEKKLSAPQDARLFFTDEIIYVIFNDYAKPIAQSQELFIGRLRKENGFFRFATAPKQLHYEESVQKIEKNWSPFAYENKLYVSYSVVPHTILEVNSQTGMTNKIDSTEPTIDWNFGPVRGGTPSLLLEEGYLSFFHSCKLGVPSPFSKKNGRVYYMGAYFFDSKPPFAIKKITPMPLANLSDYKQKNPKKIVYPGGIALDGEKLHVVWGRNDSSICVSTFDKAKLLATMVDCEVP
jgi:predicted GH43/DUF377 family glycosyl hydrolase